MNNVCIIGNAASDPELRHTGGGKEVVNFRIAVSRGKDEADFFTVIAWERLANVVNEYVTKGRRIGVTGRLIQRTWEAKDGTKRSVVEIVANTVELLGARDEAAADTSPVTVPPTAAGGDDDIPF